LSIFDIEDSLTELKTDSIKIPSSKVKVNKFNVDTNENKIENGIDKGPRKKEHY